MKSVVALQQRKRLSKPAMRLKSDEAHKQKWTNEEKTGDILKES
jgi:hypothetical protein